MNGAESLVRTLVAGGVDVCFANPGTSEMHFVAALDRVEGMRCVLGLFEGVVTGAADGYFRMKGTPASTLLHLGPGLANGLANLHNAKKANSGIVNIVGQHAVYHIAFNAPLTSDIEGLARPMSAWVRTSPDAKSVAKDGAADPEGFPPHRSGRGRRSGGVLCLSEQAKFAEAGGLRGSLHDLGRGKLGGGTGGASLGARRQAGRRQAAIDGRAGKAERRVNARLDRAGDCDGNPGKRHCGR